METIKKRLELATAMYQQLPPTQKEGFGRRLRRLTQEVAEVLGVSDRTVELDWRMARSWLYTKLKE